MPDKRKNKRPPDIQKAGTAWKSRCLIRPRLLKRIVTAPLIFSVAFGNHKNKPEISIIIVQQATSSTMRSPKVPAISSRSEEHTSELQSRFDLVCRLLL